MEAMRILVTLDEAYLPPLQVLLTSLHVNHPGESMEICLLHDGIPAEPLGVVERQCALFGFSLRPVEVDSAIFASAPVTRQYPQAMYYRLLAPHLLPEGLDRALYLDPDTLVINSLRPLWDLDLAGHLFAAASHTGKTELVHNLNQVRLKTDREYFNSGVLLMNLEAGRREIQPEAIFRYAQEHAKELVLPDQDILNALYASRILALTTTSGTTTRATTTPICCAARASATWTGSWRTPRSSTSAARPSPGGAGICTGSASCTSTTWS